MRTKKIKDKRFKETLNNGTQEQEQQYKNYNYAIDLNTGNVKNNVMLTIYLDTLYNIPSHNIKNDTTQEMYNIYISNMQDYLKAIQPFKYIRCKNHKTLIKHITNFNKMFDANYYNGFNIRVKDILNDNIRNNYINAYATATATIQKDNIDKMGIDAFINLDLDDAFNKYDPSDTTKNIINFYVGLSDLKELQKEFIKNRDITDFNNVLDVQKLIFDISLKQTTDNIQNEINNYKEQYDKIHELYEQINKTILDIVNNFKSLADKIKEVDNTSDTGDTKLIIKPRLKTPTTYTIDYNIMDLFNNIYPNYKYKSISDDRHKDLDIKAEIMFDLDLNNVDNLEDLRLINFIKSGNVQLFPIQSQLITNFIDIRDCQDSIDKPIPLLTNLKHITTNKKLRLPTSKKDLNLYEDFMLFFDKCKIKLKIINRATGDVYFEMLKPIALLTNTPAIKEGEYVYFIGNSVIEILKQQLDELYENANKTPRIATISQNKAQLFFNTSLPKTPQLINLVGYIEPKITQMINTYKNKGTYQNRINITNLYDFQALYNKHPKPTKEDKDKSREVLNKYLSDLIKQGVLTSYEPIKEKGVINAYKVIINTSNINNKKW